MCRLWLASFPTASVSINMRTMFNCIAVSGHLSSRMMYEFLNNVQQRLKDGFCLMECFWTPTSRIRLFCPRSCRHANYHRIWSSRSPDAVSSLRRLCAVWVWLLTVYSGSMVTSRKSVVPATTICGLSVISHETSCAVARCIVLSILDYCNSLFHGTAKEEIHRLQMIQNSLVRIVYNLPSRSSTEHLLNSLHWLPITKRITFKVALLAFKCKHGLAPSYLNDLILNYVPTRQLRSSHMDLLFQPRTKTVTAGRAFSATAPSVWNYLPSDLRDLHSLNVFKSKLKTFLFSNDVQL